MLIKKKPNEVHQKKVKTVRIKHQGRISSNTDSRSDGLDMIKSVSFELETVSKEIDTIFGTNRSYFNINNDHMTSSNKYNFENEIHGFPTSKLKIETKAFQDLFKKANRLEVKSKDKQVEELFTFRKQQ